MPNLLATDSLQVMLASLVVGLCCLALAAACARRKEDRPQIAVTIIGWLCALIIFGRGYVFEPVIVDWLALDARSSRPLSPGLLYYVEFWPGALLLNILYIIAASGAIPAALFMLLFSLSLIKDLRGAGLAGILVLVICDI